MQLEIKFWILNKEEVKPAFVLNLLDKQQCTERKTANGGTSLPYNKTYTGERIIQAVGKRGSTPHQYNIKEIYGSFRQLGANLKEMSYASCRK